MLPGLLFFFFNPEDSHTLIILTLRYVCIEFPQSYTHVTCKSYWTQWAYFKPGGQKCSTPYHCWIIVANHAAIRYKNPECLCPTSISVFIDGEKPEKQGLKHMHKHMRKSHYFPHIPPWHYVWPQSISGCKCKIRSCELRAVSLQNIVPFLWTLCY